MVVSPQLGSPAIATCRPVSGGRGQGVAVRRLGCYGRSPTTRSPRSNSNSANARSLVFAQGEMIAAHLQFNGVAEWREAHHLELRTNRHAHLQEPLPLLRRQVEASHSPTLTGGELGESLGCFRLTHARTRSTST